MPPESYGLTKISFNIKIGEMLQNAGVISQEQLDSVLETQKEMAERGAPKLIGDIIRDNLQISNKDIEDTFAKYLIFSISRSFQEILQKDSYLYEHIGDLQYFLNKVDICIPRWEFVDGENGKVIDAEIVLMMTSIDQKQIRVTLPFEYTIEDQVASIDLLSAVEYVKEEFLKIKGLLSGVDLNDLGIVLPESEGPVKVLYVDDEAHQRDLMQKILTRLGYIVETAKDAQSALELIEKEPFKLVITDLHMPGMDGTTLCEKIKKIDSAPVVYALSGYIASFGPDNIENAGFDGYFCKPVSFDELRGAIERTFEKIDTDENPVG